MATFTFRWSDGPLIAPAAATTAAVTAAATAPAKASAAAARAAATATFLGPCFVHRQRPTVHFLAIQGGDCRLGFLVAAHFNEPKTLGATSVAIHDDLRRLDA